jgi:O-antigen/teichoic acid export membrane protein
VNESSETPRSGATATKDAFWLVLTTSLGQVLTLGLALVLRRELGPVGMGFVAVSQLVGSYASFLSLGAMQAAEREIPIAIARGDEAGARSLELAGTAVALVVSALACAALFAFGVIRSRTDPLFGAALICSSIVLLTSQIGAWATIRLRTRLRFTALGWSGAACTVAGSLLTVFGAAIGGAGGALAGLVIAAVAQAIVLAKVSRIGGLAMPPRRSFRHLAVLSPAFFAYGVTATLLMSVDQLAVGTILGATSLGLYSAAYLGNAFVLRIPTLIGTVIYPRLQRELGATADARRVFAMASRTTDALVIAMPLLVATFFVTLPTLVFLALPEFREAIGPMRLLLVGVTGLAFGMPGAHYLVTINRQWRQVAISMLALVIMTGAYVVAGATGKMSLQVAAGVDVIVYLGYGIVMQAAAYRVAGQPTSHLLPLMPLFLVPTIELLGGAALADALVPGQDPITALLRSGLQAGLFGVTWAALAWLHLRRHAESRGDLLMVTGLITRAARRIYAALRRLPSAAPNDSGPQA